MTAEAGDLRMDVERFQNTEIGPIPIALHGIPSPPYTLSQYTNNPFMAKKLMMPC